MNNLASKLFPQRPRIAFFHPWMRVGGSEATTLWAIEAIKEDHDVTLVTPAEFSLRHLNFAFGTSLMPWEIDFLQIPPLPGHHSPEQLPRLRLNHFESYARKLGSQFDLCVSGYHPMDFGARAIHLIGDFAWDQPVSDQLTGSEEPLHPHHSALFYRSYGWVADHLFHWRSRDLFKSCDLLVPNSRWVADRLREHYSCDTSIILPPAVPMPPPAPETVRDPLGFAWVGRFTREKKFEDAVHILSQLRDQGCAVNLTVVGGEGEGEYAIQSRQLAEQHPWIRLSGCLTGADKWEVLRKQSFLLHTNPVEAFGIGVCEAAACGCVPFVPESSGVAELMSLPELSFTCAEDAVAKITRVMLTAGAWTGFSLLAQERARTYRPDEFVSRWRQVLGSFLRGSIDSMAA